MKGYLKGNYKIHRAKKIAPRAKPITSEQEFEQKALEKLGGSVAFIMKSKSFIWRGDGDRDARS